MARTSGELEKEFIETARNNTGRSLEQWLALVKASCVDKRNDIIEWLKRDHSLNHMQAQFVAGIYFNNGNPVYMNENVLLENQFEKCPNMRHLFDVISENIIVAFQGTQLIPKKTYLSFTAVREFAAVNIKPNEIRLGMDLGNRPFDEVVQKSKLTGPMPRITHMVIITDDKQFDNRLKEFLQESYNRSHKK